MAKIKPYKNGPLFAANMPKLTTDSGEKIEGKGDAYTLCRCGKSGNKPFCDGSHAKINFDSTNHLEDTRKDPIEYKGMVEGDEVVISYTPVLCGMAEQCIKNAPGVFEHGRDPWVMPEKGTKAEIAMALLSCPSGAIRVSINGSEEQQLNTNAPSIEVHKDGPYWVRNVDLDDKFKTKGADKNKYILCRCGHSKNKPFCDGSHVTKGWKDDETV